MFYNGQISSYKDNIWDILPKSIHSNLVVKRRVNIVRNQKAVKDSVKKNQGLDYNNTLPMGLTESIKKDDIHWQQNIEFAHG